MRLRQQAASRAGPGTGQGQAAGSTGRAAAIHPLRLHTSAATAGRRGAAAGASRRGSRESRGPGQAGAGAGAGSSGNGGAPSASKQVASSTPWARARMAMWDSTSVGEEVSTATTPSCRPRAGRGRRKHEARRAFGQAGGSQAGHRDGWMDGGVAAAWQQIWGGSCAGRAFQRGAAGPALAPAAAPAAPPLSHPPTGMSSLPVSLSATMTCGSSKRWPCRERGGHSRPECVCVCWGAGGGSVRQVQCGHAVVPVARVRRRGEGSSCSCPHHAHQQ